MLLQNMNMQIVQRFTGLGVVTENSLIVPEEHLAPQPALALAGPSVRFLALLLLAQLVPLRVHQVRAPLFLEELVPHRFGVRDRIALFSFANLGNRRGRLAAGPKRGLVTPDSRK